MNIDDSKDLEAAVLPSVVSNLAPIGKDLSEVALDAVMDEGVLRDIPIVGMIVGLVKTQQSIRERLYLKKMLSFLGPLSSASLGQRQQFAERINASTEEKERFSEAVVLLIDRADSSEKAELYGHFFLKHIEGRYEYEDVLKICSMIDRSFLPDLKELPMFMTAETEDNLLTGELYKNGFLSLTGLDGGTFKNTQDGGPVYSINWYGEQVVQLLRQNESS